MPDKSGLRSLVEGSTVKQLAKGVQVLAWAGLLSPRSVEVLATATLRLLQGAGKGGNVPLAPSALADSAFQFANAGVIPTRYVARA